MANETHISVGSYVELLPGREDVYVAAQAGARGWVRQSKVDDYGYGMVFIEWDRNHWKNYQGDPDGWTFESHFQVLEAPQEDIIKNFIEQVTGACPHCGHRHEEADVAKMDGYLEQLSAGLDEALGADGFFLITIKPSVDPTNPQQVVFQPRVFSESLTEEAVKMIESQIVSLATQAFQEMTARRLNQNPEET